MKIHLTLLIALPLLLSVSFTAGGTEVPEEKESKPIVNVRDSLSVKEAFGLLGRSFTKVDLKRFIGDCKESFRAAEPDGGTERLKVLFQDKEDYSPKATLYFYVMLAVFIVILCIRIFKSFIKSPLKE